MGVLDALLSAHARLARCRSADFVLVFALMRIEVVNRLELATAIARLATLAALLAEFRSVTVRENELRVRDASSPA
jgi:hypothetical protein